MFKVGSNISRSFRLCSNCVDVDSLAPHSADGGHLQRTASAEHHRAYLLTRGSREENRETQTSRVGRKYLRARLELEYPHKSGGCEMRAGLSLHQTPELPLTWSLSQPRASSRSSQPQHLFFVTFFDLTEAVPISNNTPAHLNGLLADGRLVKSLPTNQDELYSTIDDNLPYHGLAS